MNLSLNILLLKLQLLGAKSYISSDLHTPIEGVIFYSEKVKSFSPSYAYICNLSILETLSVPTEDICFFCIDDTNSNNEERNQIKRNFVVFEDAESLFDISNSFAEVLSSFSKWDKECHHLILNDCTLDQIMELYSRFIDYPIIIFDPSFKIIYYSKTTQYQEKDFLNAVNTSYTPPDIMGEMQRKKMITTVNESKQCILKHGISIPSNYNIYRCHSIGGKIRAHSVIYCGSGKPPHGLIDIAEIFLKNLDFFFKENQKQDTLGTYMYEYLLSSLISNKEENDKVLSDRLKYIDLPFNSDFILTKLEFENKTEVPSSYLCNLIKNYLPSLKPFLYGNEIFILLNFNSTYNKKYSYLVKVFTDLKNHLGHYPFVYYISNEFFNITDIIYAYNQCNVTQNITSIVEDKPSDLNFYKDICAYHELIYLEKDYDLNTLCISEYWFLKNYDIETGSNLCETLYSYLKNNCDLKTTAADLHIHRNTADNHIKKINELIPIDLNDFKTRYSLIRSFFIQEYLQSKHV